MASLEHASAARQAERAEKADAFLDGLEEKYATTKQKKGGKKAAGAKKGAAAAASAANGSSTDNSGDQLVTRMSDKNKDAAPAASVEPAGATSATRCLRSRVTPNNLPAGLVAPLPEAAVASRRGRSSQRRGGGGQENSNQLKYPIRSRPQPSLERSFGSTEQRGFAPSDVGSGKTEERQEIENSPPTDVSVATSAARSLRSRDKAQFSNFVKAMEDPEKTPELVTASNKRALEKRKAGEVITNKIKPKRKKMCTSNQTEEYQDVYCWVCHKQRVESGWDCSRCCRTFHSECIPNAAAQQHDSSAAAADDWTCPVCILIMEAESADTGSLAMRLLTPKKFANSLMCALKRMKHADSEPFEKPVSKSKLPDYYDVVFHPMDLSTLEKNIKKRQYASTVAFLEDAKWILHNCIIFNGLTSNFLADAKWIIEICAHEMRKIDDRVVLIRRNFDEIMSSIATNGPNAVIEQQQLLNDTDNRYNAQGNLADAGFLQEMFSDRDLLQTFRDTECNFQINALDPPTAANLSVLPQQQQNEHAVGSISDLLATSVSAGSQTSATVGGQNGAVLNEEILEGFNAEEFVVQVEAMEESNEAGGDVVACGQGELLRNDNVAATGDISSILGQTSGEGLVVTGTNVASVSATASENKEQPPPMAVATESLEASPPEIQEEILAQQRTARAACEPPPVDGIGADQGGDPAALTERRQQLLSQKDGAELAALPEPLAAETCHCGLESENAVSAEASNEQPSEEATAKSNDDNTATASSQKVKLAMKQTTTQGSTSASVKGKPLSPDLARSATCATTIRAGTLAARRNIVLDRCGVQPRRNYSGARKRPKQNAFRRISSSESVGSENCLEGAFKRIFAPADVEPDPETDSGLLRPSKRRHCFPPSSILSPACSLQEVVFGWPPATPMTVVDWRPYAGGVGEASGILGSVVPTTSISSGCDEQTNTRGPPAAANLSIVQQQQQTEQAMGSISNNPLTTSVSAAMEESNEAGGDGVGSGRGELRISNIAATGDIYNIHGQSSGGGLVATGTSFGTASSAASLPPASHELNVDSQPKRMDGSRQQADSSTETVTPDSHHVSDDNITNFVVLDVVTKASAEMIITENGSAKAADNASTVEPSADDTNRSIPGVVEQPLSASTSTHFGVASAARSSPPASHDYFQDFLHEFGPVEDGVRSLMPAGDALNAELMAGMSYQTALDQYTRAVKDAATDLPCAICGEHVLSLRAWFVHHFKPRHRALTKLIGHFRSKCIENQDTKAESFLHASLIDVQGQLKFSQELFELKDEAGCCSAFCGVCCMDVTSNISEHVRSRNHNVAYMNLLHPEELAEIKLQSFKTAGQLSISEFAEIVEKFLAKKLPKVGGSALEMVVLKGNGELLRWIQQYAKTLQDMKQHAEGITEEMSRSSSIDASLPPNEYEFYQDGMCFLICHSKRDANNPDDLAKHAATAEYQKKRSVRDFMENKAHSVMDGLVSVMQQSVEEKSKTVPLIGDQVRSQSPERRSESRESVRRPEARPTRSRSLSPPRRVVERSPSRFSRRSLAQRSRSHRGESRRSSRERDVRSAKEGRSGGRTNSQSDSRDRSERKSPSRRSKNTSEQRREIDHWHRESESGSRHLREPQPPGVMERPRDDAALMNSLLMEKPQSARRQGQSSSAELEALPASTGGGAHFCNAPASIQSEIVMLTNAPQSSSHDGYPSGGSVDGSGESDCESQQAFEADPSVRGKRKRRGMNADRMAKQRAYKQHVKNGKRAREMLNLQKPNLSAAPPSVSAIDPYGQLGRVSGLHSTAMLRQIGGASSSQQHSFAAALAGLRQPSNQYFGMVPLHRSSPPGGSGRSTPPFEARSACGYWNVGFNRNT